MTNQTTPTPNSNNSLCDDLLALIPAYALGATDPEDTRWVERHLHDCPEALAELALYTDITDALLFASGLVAAPPELTAKIAQIPYTEKKTAPPEDSSTKVIQPPIFTPATLPNPQSESRPTRRISIWQFGAAAAILILVWVNVIWLNQVNSLQNEKQAILGELSQQDAVLEALTATDSVSTSLASTVNTNSSARVLWSPSEEIAVLRVENLPNTSADRAYQLWLINAAGDQFVSAGVFRVAEDGSFVGIIAPDTAIGEFAAFGITEEPSAGSQQPTSAPVLLGNI